jgi:LacI family transcriptional regulator
MTVTIKEIAEKAHVSIATVSRALNDNKKVKSSTRKAILDIAKNLNYVPNAFARSLVKNDTKIIGLVLPDLEGEFFTEIFRGVDEVAYSEGFHTIVASSHGQRSIAEAILNFMGESFVKGMIILIPVISEQIKEIIRRSSIPVIIINAKNDISNVDSVGIDNYQGSYLMTEYLIKTLGYKKIAHIKGPLHNNDSLQRFKGYTDAMKNCGLECREEWIVNGSFNVFSGEQACRRLLSLNERPEVIFAANDMMALGCYKAVKSFGLTIPDDIGIAGFDDIFIAEFLSPRLTTVHVPISDIGKTSAGVLLERIKNGNGRDPRHIKISTGLVIKESCRKRV